MTTASQVMTRPVLSVAMEARVEAAGRLMLEHHVSGLPVVDTDGRIVGMLTEGDLLRRAETGTLRGRSAWRDWLAAPGKLAQEYVHTHAQQVGEIMAIDVISVRPDTPLERVVSLMEAHRIKRVPVTEDGRPVGIVSRANLVALLVGALEAAAPGAQRHGGDEQIRQAIRDALIAQPWAPRAMLDMAVHGGVVDLNGIVCDEREREALRVLVENIPGVKALNDRLTWIEPITGTVVLPDAP